MSNALRDAALDGEWEPALSAFAQACGADHGQLIGVGSDAAVPFNWVTGFDPELMRESAQISMGDPALNPRVWRGIADPVLGSWHDAACASDSELRRNFVYADFCRRAQIPHGSQATLIRENGMLIGLASLRSARRGVPPAEDREAFDALKPHVLAAVRTQMALEGQGAKLIGGALEALQAAAFVCDGGGRVQAMTLAAEAALRTGPLRLAGSRLRMSGAGEALDEAIDAARLGDPLLPANAFRTLVLRAGPDPADVAVVDVAALPRRAYAFGFEPRVLVVLRGAGGKRDDLAWVLSKAFALTTAEADIAVRLAQGEGRDAIAEHRRASVETVRGHIKSIFAKLDVRREAELVARLSRLS